MSDDILLFLLRILVILGAVVALSYITYPFVKALGL